MIKRHLYFDVQVGVAKVEVSVQVVKENSKQLNQTENVFDNLYEMDFLCGFEKVYGGFEKVFGWLRKSLWLRMRKTCSLKIKLSKQS